MSSNKGKRTKVKITDDYIAIDGKILPFNVLRTSDLSVQFRKHTRAVLVHIEADIATTDLEMNLGSQED